jgi:ankyrin repeat protein
MMVYLLDKGADIEARDKEGNPPLMVTGKKEIVECIELLSYRGADINAKNTSGHTALHLAKASSTYKTHAVRRLASTMAALNNELERSSQSRVSTSCVRTSDRRPGAT